MKRAARAVEAILRGITCLHPRMRECHRGCGHWLCPDCGLFYDEIWDGGIWRQGSRAMKRANQPAPKNAA